MIGLLFRRSCAQTLLPGAAEPSTKRPETQPPDGQRPAKKPAPNYKVRMDPSHRTLDAMLTVNDPSQRGAYTETHETQPDQPVAGPSRRRQSQLNGTEDEPLELSDEDEGQLADGERESLWDTPAEKTRGAEIPESMCEFKSIIDLRRAAKKRASAGKSKVA